MKKSLLTLLLILCFVSILFGCKKGNELPSDEHVGFVEDGGNVENNQTNNNYNENRDEETLDSKTDEPVVLEVKNGTEVAKILLANQRLDSSDLEKSGSLFTEGREKLKEIAYKSREYLRKNKGRPNETYTEVDGETYKWYNDVDYSNFMSYFESYAVNIESSAERGADLIDYTKSNIFLLVKSL